MDAYGLLKFVHVLLAIVALGFNASYGIWLARARRQPQQLAFALDGVRVLDRIANVGYGLLLVTGISLVLVGQISFTTFWIASAIFLYILVLLIGIGVYAPTFRDQARALESAGADSEEYRTLERRSTVLGIAVSIIVVAIVFLMVTKPTL